VKCRMSSSVSSVFRVFQILANSGQYLDGKKFEVEGKLLPYEFIIHDIGHNALDIVAFFKYRKIVSSQGPIENQLNQLISKTSNDSVLRRVAFDRKYYLYNENVNVDIYGDDYTFKIDGIGPEAIKITIQITYGEIVTSNNALESILRDLITTIYHDELNDAELIEKINFEWNKEEAEKQKIREEVQREEEIRAQKQKELEEFLIF